MKERIRKIRRYLDLTQQEFADRLGIKRGAIANYELGRNEPVDSVVSLICREYGVNEEWLRTGTGEMFEPDSGDELEALAKKYDLSNADQVLIEKYVNLKPGSREAIINFITDVVAGLDGTADLNSKEMSTQISPTHQKSWSESSRRWKIQRKAGWVKNAPSPPGPLSHQYNFYFAGKIKITINGAGAPIVYRVDILSL